VSGLLPDTLPATPHLLLRGASSVPDEEKQGLKGWL